MKTKAIYIIVTYQGEGNYAKERMIPVNGIYNLYSSFVKTKVVDRDVVYIHSIGSVDRTELEVVLHQATDLLQSKGDTGAYCLMPLTEAIDENGDMALNKFPFLLSEDGQIKQARYVILF